MIEVTVTDGQRARAEALYPFGALPRSITRGASNVYGALGEVLFADHHPGWVHDPGPDWDFTHPRWGTADVKTKRTTAVPAGHWHCSVAATSLHQRCDYWYFLRVDESLSFGWLLGWVARDDLFDRGFFARAGETDGGTGFRYRVDCWNVRVDRLNRPARP